LVLGTGVGFSYPKSVRFRCDRCAVCCGDTENHARHILLLREEARAISRVILKPVEAFATEIEGRKPYVYEMRKTGAEGKCFFLHGTDCRVYEQRPLVCRFYPFKLATLKGKHRFRCTSECPGMGKGRRLERDYFEELFRQACDRLKDWETEGI
jgi:Fe-S-cluster containining protein